MENGVIRGYQVTYYQTDLGTDNSTVLNTNSSDLEFSITGLQPFTNYSVSVAAITIAAGPASGVVEVRTNENGERNYILSECPPFKKGTSLNSPGNIVLELCNYA